MIWIIQQVYAYRDRDNYPASDTVIEEDHGFFFNAEEATEYVNGLNQAVLERYAMRPKAQAKLSFSEWATYAETYYRELVAVELHVD